MAFLRKKYKDTWYLVDKSNGKFQSIKLGKISYSEAKTVLARYQIDQTYLKLDLNADSNITFQEVVEEYLKIAPTRKSSITVKAETEVLNFLSKTFGSMKLKNIQLEAYENFLREKKYAPNTIRLKIAALRSLHDFAIKRRYIREDISRQLKSPTIPTLPPKHVTQEVIEKVFNELTVRTKSKFLILNYTGMRPIELLRLQARDIDLKNRNVIVRYAKTKRFRLIPIHTLIFPVLVQLIENKKPEDYLFPSKKGGHQRTLERGLKIACKRAGVRGVTPNVYRHQFATTILDKTRDIRTAQQLLGHTDIRTTTRYATSLDSRLKEAVEALE